MSHLLDLRTVQNNFNVCVEHSFDTLFENDMPLVKPTGTVSARVMLLAVWLNVDFRRR